MFDNKKCSNCKSKIKEKFDFCPHCGHELREDSEENFGLLGKTDKLEDQIFNDPFFGGGLTGGIFGKMLNSTMKMLEKELAKEMKDMNSQPNLPRTNFELFINGQRVDPRNIKVKQMPLLQQPMQAQQQKIQKQKEISSVFSKDKSQKFLELKREEPQTSSVRRLSNRVIYEIDMPEVKSVEDVSIIRMGNSIEIKAIGKQKAYSKVIPIGLPVVSYSLSAGKLILELGTKD